MWRSIRRWSRRMPTVKATTTITAAPSKRVAAALTLETSHPNVLISVTRRIPETHAVRKHIQGARYRLVEQRRLHREAHAILFTIQCAPHINRTVREVRARLGSPTRAKVGTGARLFRYPERLESTQTSRLIGRSTSGIRRAPGTP